jgi:hypothetical protein
MNAPLALPRWTWVLFGERPVALEVIASLTAGALGAAAWVAQTRPAASWQAVGAALLVADVVAGCLANFTRSTQLFYSARPRLRWAFIAVHGHIIGFALLANEPLQGALLVWLTTMVGALVANRFRDSVVVGGGVLLTGLVLIVNLELSATLTTLSLLYFLKVAFAFSTRHHTA